MTKAQANPINSVSSTVRVPRRATSGKTAVNAWSRRAVIAFVLLCALGTVLAFLEFSLLPGVTWLTYDASCVPALVCGFAFGPAAGLACGTISIIFKGVMSAELSGAIVNFLVMAGIVLPAAFVFKYFGNFKGALIGLVLGCVCAVVVAAVGNVVLAPSWLGVPLDAVLDMIVPVLVPFNLFKGLLNAVLTLVVYKPIVALAAPRNEKGKGR